MSSSEINNEWRRVASAIYRKPVDSKIFGSVEIDVTDLETFISEKRKEGLKITLTHFFTLVVARGISEVVPELNSFVRRGKIIERKQVDAMVSVLIGESQMSSVRVPHADKLSVQELADYLNQGIQQTRSGDENPTMKMKGVVARIPWPLRDWFFNVIKRLTVGWGISIPSIGLTADNFGSFVITNVGTIGLDIAYPAPFPLSNVAMVVVLGNVSKKPVVRNDKVVIRRMLTVSSGMDHRVVDAVHGGKLFRYIRHAVKDPESFVNSPIS